MIAEGPGHAATARLDRFDREPRHQPKDRLKGRHGGEGLLVAMTVNQRAGGLAVLEVEFETARLVLGGENSTSGKLARREGR